MAHLFLLLLSGYLLSVSQATESSPDMVAAESIASDYKVQSADSSGKYGYPYRIAPTLAPRIQARSDDDEDESVQVAQAKSYGSRIRPADDETAVKKGSQKKSKILQTQGPTRRQDSEDSSVEKNFRSYREPKYRNFEELEADFQPRRMDINIPYSQYEYHKYLRKPSLSPRDPFLSPSAEPVDSFYPSSPKIKSFSSSSYEHRNRGPSYGAGKYDDPLHYHSDDIHHEGGYGGPSTSFLSSGGLSSKYPSSGGSSPSYPSSGGSSHSYPPNEGGYGYQDYTIKSNEPITGNIRKKLLDYAGASDLYKGEPDYLQEVSRNKYKYGNIGNDYYAYGGPGYRDSYREFPYVESKISLIKKSRRV